MRRPRASIAVLIAGTLGPAFAQGSPADSVTARGRLEPRNGVRRVAGPAELVSVVAKLHVEEGDGVRPGQLLAVMDTFAVRDAHVRKLRTELASGEAAIARHRAEAENAREEEERASRLFRDGVGPASEAERWRKRREAADAALAQAQAEHATLRAALQAAEAERDRAVVRAPIAGKVIKVHARPGERVGEQGILELGDTGAMYAVAEVYETDAPRVKPGLRAEVRSPALSRALTGVVERVGLKVGRLSAVGADPAARNDARAVEVKVRLDDSAAAAALTDLEVEITIRLR